MKKTSLLRSFLSLLFISSASLFLQPTMAKSTETKAALKNTARAEKTAAMTALAQQHFAKDFATATDAKWYSVNGESFVEYTYNQLPQKTCYSDKGKPLYTITYGASNNLPQDIYQKVRSNYYDHTITYANRYEIANQTIWIIGLSNQPEYITLRVTSDEMDEMEHYSEKP